MGLIVTGRFHMVCLAMLARTPFIALEGNTHKIEGVLADANLSNRFCSALPDGLDLLAWSKWHDEEFAALEAFLQEARSRISRMFFRIRQLATRR
jgi:polysaccharide pyruvyl transferase WcaK-like protein